MMDSLSLVFYLSIFAISIMFSAIYQKKEKRNKRCRVIYALLTIVPVALMQGCRYGVGTDFFAYAGIFMKLGVGDTYYTNRYISEPLFLLENKILYSAFGDSQSLFVFDALIMGLFVFLAFSYFKESVSMPIMYLGYYLWIYPSFLNLERQGIAMAIFWFSLRFLVERKPLQYCLWIFVATGFHNSSIIFLLLYFINLFDNLIFRKFVKWFLITVLLFGSLFYKTLVLFMIDKIRGIDILSKYIVYYAREEGMLMGSGNGTFVYLLLFCIPFIIFYKQLKKNQYYNNIWLLILLLNFILLFISRMFSYGGRIAIYTNIALICLIGMTYRQITLRSNRQIYIMLYSGIFLFYFIRIYYYLGSSEIFPYQTIWNLEVY